VSGYLFLIFGHVESLISSSVVMLSSMIDRTVLVFIYALYVSENLKLYLTLIHTYSWYNIKYDTFKIPNNPFYVSCYKLQLQIQGI
jgi:hypothetical protein